jgi:hypothetical protein
MNLFSKTLLFLVLFIFAFSPLGFGFYAGLSGNTCYASSFNIEQSSGNKGGTNKRHIDISSQHSGAYFSESSVMVGFVEITESFGMNNVGGSGKSGSTFSDDWYSGFGANDMPGSNSVDSPFFEAGQDLNPLPDNNPPIAAESSEAVSSAAVSSQSAEGSGESSPGSESKDPIISAYLAMISALRDYNWLELY